MLTFKRKLKLTKAQEKRLESWIGACRWVYNAGLEIKITAWRNKQINISAYDLMKQATQIKDTEWIADVPANSIEESIKRLDFAYKKFFKGAGFPKFKSKKHFNSITFRKDARFNNVSVNDNCIKIPKIGALKIFKDSPIKGTIKTVTIVREINGWFVCIVTDAIKDIQCNNENQVIGLDVGIKYFSTDSNGEHIKNPGHFKKHKSRLRVAQRSLERKKRGSNRWKKQVQRVARIHSRIRNARVDFLHKQSTIIAKNFNTVYLEDLNINRMAKDGFGGSVLDCGWGMFRRMLEYKTNVVAVNPKYTSQTCNECGCRNSRNRISQSEFVCVECGHVSNADKNAAKVILSRGAAINRKRKALA